MKNRKVLKGMRLIIRQTCVLSVKGLSVTLYFLLIKLNVPLVPFAGIFSKQMNGQVESEIIKNIGLQIVKGVIRVREKGKKPKDFIT